MNAQSCNIAQFQNGQTNCTFQSFKIIANKVQTELQNPKSTRAAQSQRYQKLSKRIWKDIKVQNAVNKVHREKKYAEKN